MAGRYDFTHRQNTTFSATLTWKDAIGVPDRPDRVVRRACRSGTWPQNALAADLSTADGSIVLGGTDGTIALTIAAADTAAMRPGVAKYDLLVTNTTPATSACCTATSSSGGGSRQ